MLDQLLANTADIRASHAEKRRQLYTAQNVAMIALMRDAYLTPRDTDDVRWNDFEYRPDGSAELHFRRDEGKPPAQVSAETVRLFWQACRIESTTRKFTGEGRVYNYFDEDVITQEISSVMKTAGLQGRYTCMSPLDGMILDQLLAGHAAAEVAEAARLKDTARIPEQFQEQPHQPPQYRHGRTRPC